MSRWLAGLVVGPLLELAGHLSNWAPGAPDLSVRRDDEVGRLVEAFNRVQNRVEESLTFEREFAFNLSHEIRGALAAIRTDAEMLTLEATLRSEEHTSELQALMRSTIAVLCLKKKKTH